MVLCNLYSGLSSYQQIRSQRYYSLVCYRMISTRPGGRELRNHVTDHNLAQRQRFCDARFRIGQGQTLSVGSDHAHWIGTCSVGRLCLASEIYEHVVYCHNKQGKWKRNQEEKFYDAWINRADEFYHSDTREYIKSDCDCYGYRHRYCLSGSSSAVLTWRQLACVGIGYPDNRPNLASIAAA